MSVPVCTLNKMGTYPLYGIVHVFLLIVLVVAGRQTVLIFRGVNYFDKIYDCTT